MILHTYWARSADPGRRQGGSGAPAPSIPRTLSDLHLRNRLDTLHSATWQRGMKEMEILKFSFILSQLN